jgi:hypothetical protein
MAQPTENPNKGFISDDVRRDIDLAGYPPEHCPGDGREYGKGDERQVKRTQEVKSSRSYKRADSGTGERPEERMMGRHALRSEGRKGGRR